jgi:hypothetical protein
MARAAGYPKFRPDQSSQRESPIRREPRSVWQPMRAKWPPLPPGFGILVRSDPKLSDSQRGRAAATGGGRSVPSTVIRSALSRGARPEAVWAMRVLIAEALERDLQCIRRDRPTLTTGKQVTTIASMIFTNQHRSRWRLLVRDSGFDYMRDGQKKKKYECCVAHFSFISTNTLSTNLERRT